MDDDQKSSKDVRPQTVTDDELNIIKDIVSLFFIKSRNSLHCIYCCDTSVVTHSILL